MKYFLLKYKKNFFIGLTVILTLLNLANLFFIFKIAPQSNDECLWRTKKISPDSTVIFITLVKKNGVTWKAGIRDGDQLLAINGREVKNTRYAQFILNNVSEGDSANYLIKRDNKTFIAKVKVKKLINFRALGYTLLSFIWVLVGFVVILAKPEGEIQKLFFFIGVSFTLASTSSFFIVGFMQNPYFFVNWLVIIVDLLSLVGTSYLPFFLIHFFWVFPRRAKIISKKYTVKILYVIPTILLFLELILRIKYFYFSPTNLFSKPTLILILAVGLPSILTFVGMLIGLISLFRSYLKLENKRERNAIFIILTAYTIGIIAIIYTSTLANVLADTVFNSPEYFMPIIAVAIIPIAFGYSIFRYSLMDVTEVIKNAILYGVATVTLAIIYFLVIYVLGENIGQALSTEYQGVLTAAIFIIFAIVFQSTKDKFQTLLTKKFYPEQFAYQKVILKFSNEIASIIGLENILDSTLQTFVNALSIKHFAILLKEGDEVYVLKRGEGTRTDEFKLRDLNSNLKKFIEKKQKLNAPVVIEDTDFEIVLPNNYKLLLKEEIHTIIPLIVKNKIVGLLLFGLKRSGANFAGKDIELLTAAANQVAVAIENARLYESEAEKLKLERDIENARKIQESLLPKDFPVLPNLEICGRMLPALQIGGDYFDLIKVSDNELFIIVADVSGKGLSASFYMSKIQTMMRLYCKAGNSPTKILSKINEEIFGDIKRNWFITMSLALFNSSTSTLKLVRAGHTPLYLRRDNKLLQYQPTGIGVGLAEKSIFDENLKEITLKLQKGDLLLFYSDGLTDSMDPSGKLYGEERLKEIFKKVSPAESCNSILTQILKSEKNFRNGAPQNDDITLIVLKSLG